MNQITESIHILLHITLKTPNRAGKLLYFYCFVKKLMFNDKKLLTNIKNGIIFDLSINIKYLTKGNFIMKEEAIKKINKVGHIGYVISKIGKICLTIGFVALIIAELVLCFLPKDLFKINVNGTVTIDVNISSAEKFSKIISLNNDIEDIKQYGKLTISDDEYSVVEIDADNDIIHVSAIEDPHADVTVVNVRAAVFIAMFVIAAAYVLMTFIMKMFKALEVCNTPFDETIIEGLKKFSFGLIGFVVVEAVSATIIKNAMQGLDNYAVSINISSVLVALAVYALSVIFKYGAMLQQESDETL